MKISDALVENDAPLELAYARLEACPDDESRIAATARLILAIFDDFYSLLCEYPYRAKCAFELMDPHASIRISKERLGLYSRYIAEHGPRVLGACPALSHDAALWEAIDRLFVAMIVDRYEADTAFSFAHSLRRNICQEFWRPVAYSFPPPSKLRAFSMASVHRRLPIVSRIDAELIASFLRVPGFSVPFRDSPATRKRIVERVDALLYGSPDDPPPVALDVVEAGFFRDRSAFVVGSWVRSDDSIVPFVVALHNSSRGHLRRCGAASSRGHSWPVQLGAGQFSRHHAPLLSNLRVSLQPHAAAAAGSPLFDDRLQSRRQGRDPERDHRADACERTALPALARRPGDGGRWGSPSMPAPTI